MANAIEAGRSIALLDDRLEAATRSDDPDVIRNTITALVLLKGRSRLKLLAGLLSDLIRRVRSEGDGDSRHFPLLEHAHRSLKSLDAESLHTVREQVDANEDREISIAVLALLPEDPTAPKTSLIRSWLVARNAWPRFRFWRLFGVAAGAATLAVLSMWLLLLGLAFGLGSGANPWGLRELSVLLTIMVIASLTAAVSGWMASAGGAAKFGQATLLLDSVIWGAIASGLGTFVLWVLPDLLPFIAWVRGGSGALMAQWLLVTWALLFVATTGSRMLSSWLVEYRSDSSRTYLVLLSAGVPAFLTTLFVMLGLGGLRLLRGEMIGIWLLVVALAFAAAAVSVAVETPASRMEALRARGDKHISLTPWVVAVMLALLLTVVARPVFTKLMAAGDSVEFEIPLPGARIIAVRPETRLEVRLEGAGVSNALLLVKNAKDATSTFAVSARLGGGIDLTTQGSSLVVCVLSADELTGGTTSPFCEQPSLRWIADIFNAPTSIGTRALVSIRPLPARAYDDIGHLDRPVMRYLTAATSQFTVSEPTTIYVSLIGAPPFDERHPENSVRVSLERLRNDGFSGSTFIGDRHRLEAGTYLLCARRPRDAVDVRRRLTAMLSLRRGVPSSYVALSGAPCDSREQRAAPGVRIAVASIPDRVTFREAGMARGRGATVAGGYVPIHVNAPALLIAEFQGASTTADAILVLTRVAAVPGEAPRQSPEAQADDPEEMVRALAPGDYQLCTRQFDEESGGPETCAPPGIDGTITYRLIPLSNLSRSPAN